MNSIRALAAQKIFIPLLYNYWNTPVLQRYEELMSHENRHQKELSNLQEEKLSDILRYSILNIPYYQNFFAEKGIGIKNIESPDALQLFPVLTKEMIQKNFEELSIPNPPSDAYVIEHSGGSTGQPTKVRRYFNARAYVHAATWRANAWIGWAVGDPWMWLWGRLSSTKTSWRLRVVNLYKAVFIGDVFFNIHPLDTTKMFHFIRLMSVFKPKVLVGYTNAMYHLALMIQEHGIVIPSPSGIATTAETLFPDQRALIEKVFGCKVFNRYASSEVGLIASECSAQEGLHIAMENVFIECVSEDGSPAPPGEPGKLLVTDLNNRVMPLIRYDLGDMGIISPAPCKCGRPYPLLKKVIGRQSDVLRLPNKKIVFPDDLAEIFYPLDSVKKFQVIQEELSSVNVFVALKSGGKDESLKALIYRQLQEALGDGTDIKLDFVEDIPILPSGKHRICISKLAAPYS